MENNSYEQEIDLKDLMFVVLHKWRIVIIAAVLMGVLLGGFKLVSGLNQLNDKDAIETAQKEYEEAVIQYDIARAGSEKEIDNLQASIDDYYDYIQKSIWMQINPYDKWVAKANLFVKAATPALNQGGDQAIADLTDSIVKSYSSMLSSDDAVSALAEKKELDVSYLKELLTIQPDYDGNMVEIQAAYTDKMGAEELLQAVLDYQQMAQVETEMQFGEHTAQFLNQNVSSYVDVKLSEKQQKARRTVVDLQSTLNTTKKSINDMVKPTAAFEQSSIMVGIKYGIMGCILGAFVAVFMICVSFLMSDRLSSEKELKKRFGIKSLGIFSTNRRRRVFGKVDQWLDRLEGKEHQADSVVFEIIAANVNNYARGIESILVTGTVENEKLEAVIQYLKEKFPEKTWNMASELNQNLDALRVLSNYEGVILVEELGRSHCKKIQMEVEVLTEMNKKIIGGII